MATEKKHYYDLTEAIEIIEHLKEERSQLQHVLMRVIDVVNGNHSARHLRRLIIDVAAESRGVLRLPDKNPKLGK